MSHVRHDHAALSVVVDSAAEVDSALGAAVGTLQKRAATSPCCGILVTREGAGRYTVALDESVPFGLTQQRCA
ncbi:hypothetical protein [Sinomonas halotolerans]|uniref:Uncharacterized protein n=1 Tax=Sinomonas halotolerans TaxID=1644133 RepID=A0ABU9WZ81_9MICC